MSSPGSATLKLGGELSLKNEWHDINPENSWNKPKTWELVFFCVVSYCFSSYLKNQPTISTHNRPFHSVPPPNQEAPPRLAPRKSPEIPSFQVPSSEFLVCFPWITALRYETRGVNVSQKICLLDTLELSLNTECRHQLLLFAHPFSWFSNQMLSSFCWVLSIQSVFFLTLRVDDHILWLPIRTTTII